MRTLLRTLSLVTALALSTFATARATGENCHITCAGGGTWDITTSSYFECCQVFNSYCGSNGDAYWDGNGREQYCLSIGS